MAASPESKTVIPKAKPSHAPARGPINADPMTIGTSVNVIANVGPLIGMNCNITTSAVKIASIVIVFVLIFLFAIIFLPHKCVYLRKMNIIRISIIFS